MAASKPDPDGPSDPRSDAPDLIEAMLEGLVQSGQADKMEGLDLDRLRAAMSAPGAAKMVATVQALGAHSTALVGQPAPDFELPYLPGQGKADGERLRLSLRTANRPVALVFGSYT